MDCEFISFRKNDTGFTQVRYKGFCLTFLTSNGYIDVGTICSQMNLCFHDFANSEQTFKQREYLDNIKKEPSDVFLPFVGLYYHPLLAKLLIFSSFDIVKIKDFLHMIRQFREHMTEERAREVEEMWHLE
jgi:hypothetical protein